MRGAPQRRGTVSQASPLLDLQPTTSMSPIRRVKDGGATVTELEAAIQGASFQKPAAPKNQIPDWLLYRSARIVMGAGPKGKKWPLYHYARMVSAYHRGQNPSLTLGVDGQEPPAEEALLQ
jgi:hypothetical protein